VNVRRSRRRARLGLAARTLRALAIACLVAAAVWWVPPASPPRLVEVARAPRIVASPTTIGVDVDAPSSASDAAVAQVLDATADAGLTTIRLTIPLPGRTRDGLDWAGTDRVVDAAIRRNLAILGTLEASDAAPEFADFCTVVAARYRGKVSAYEVDGGALDARGLADRLIAAYPRIKDADPAAVVVGGSTRSSVDPAVFLQQLYDAGARNTFDALSFHPAITTWQYDDGAPGPSTPLGRLIALRRTMIAGGDAAKRIWATDYAGASGTDLLRAWRQLPYTGPVVLRHAPDPAAVAAGPAGAAFARFGTVTEPRYGEVLSPVYRAAPDTWAQIRTAATVYATDDGFVASPNPVADLARAHDVLPRGTFAGGFQDMATPSPMRVWWSPTTGAHAAGAGIVAAWTPPLGLAVTDEVPDGAGVRVTFQHGYVTWAPGAGAVVHPA
jgi:polysaccharide biosynthesis protein PslG